MRKILVIGGGGYVGIKLVKTLLKDDENHAIVLGRSSNESLDVLLDTSSNLEFLQQDLIDLNPSKSSLPDVDHIYYLASGTFPASSWQNPTLEINASLLPFFNLMETLFIRNYSSNFTFISSGGTVYGDSVIKDNGYTEECLTLPFVPYGIFKKTQEDLLRHYQKKLSFPLYIYRVGNVYGPNESIQKEYGVINIWLKRILNNEAISIFGSGEIIRDYIYIDDLAKILSLNVVNIIEPGLYNISSGIHPSLNDLIKIIESLMGNRIQIDKLESRGADVRRVVLDGTKFNEKYQFDHTSLETGIKKTIDFLKLNENSR